MKKILITLFAVIATASVVQASSKKHTNLPEYNVTAEQFQFIDARLEAVVEEETAKALAEPVPASAIADANAKARPRMRFALTNGAKDIVLVAISHS